MDRTDAGQRGAKPFQYMLWVLVVLPFCAYAALQLGALGSPLFWQDEGETAMFGQRILDHGYPKVHDGGNVVYGMGVPLEYAVEGENDAYTGSLWGQYYLAALGVWLAQGIEEVHAHTARVRLPFALLGMAGLVVLFLSVSPLFSGRTQGRAAAFAGYGLFLCLSTSLMLHLREVRYYAPALACLGAVVWLQMRRPPGLGEGGPGRAWGLGAALLLLFNFFHPAALAAGLWVCVEWFVRARRAPAGLRAQFGRARSLWLCLAAFGAGALWIALAFGIPTLSRIFSERWGFGPELYGANLVLVAQYLLRYELLGPVLLAEAVLWLRRPRDPGRQPSSLEPPSLEPSSPEPASPGLISARGSLLRLAFLYALVGAGNPIFFERYFVPVGPLLILILLLDMEILWRGFGLGASASQAWRARSRAIGVSAGLLASILWLRSDELVGRFDEIRRPVVGPVDAAIEFIQARYPDPAALTIATNYEAEPYMYYLGSRVVGRFHGGTPGADAAEAAVEPDLVIPRSAQPRSLRAVRRYLIGHSFDRHELSVADVAYNNIPELSEGRLLSTTHRFTTPRPGEDGPPLAIYARRRGHED